MSMLTFVTVQETKEKASNFDIADKLVKKAQNKVKVQKKIARRENNTLYGILGGSE